ncbi:MAG: glycosyltransferase [Bacteriovoracaceae bacterium]|jgi:glycosyltransferase involved in cell wall biosynthesis|nr:glycosyltransferase [Bacteriovoracaceae bacterium]
MSRDHDGFIVFGEDYGRRAHCLEHLMNQFSNDTQILWVETVGLRAPKLNLYDIKRSFQKLRSLFVSKENNIEGFQVPDNIKVIRPLMLPFFGSKICRAFNKASVARSIKKATTGNQTSYTTLITSIPNTGDFLDLAGAQKTIYYCVDEFKLWPLVDSKLLTGLEDELIKKADIVLTTSKHLYQTRIVKNPNTHMFTHGVDTAHFELPPPKSHERPIYIYYGIIDERCDQEILKNIAQRTDNGEIHIYGPVNCNIDNLKGQKNIFFHGHVSYSELPKVIENGHIFILPYKINALTRTIYPLKIKEYIMTGRPVVATALPDLEELKSSINIEADADGFVQKCLSIEKSGPFFSETLRESFKKSESWSSKKETFINLISAH